MPDTPAKPSFRLQAALAAAVLLLAYAAACLKIARDTSPTFDEPDYLAVGYHALVTGQRPYTNINLTFTQMWSAVPLLLAGTPPEIEMPPDWPAAKAVRERNAAGQAARDQLAAELAAKDKTAPPPPDFKPERPPLMPVTWLARTVRSLSPVTLFPRSPHFPTIAEQSATGLNYGRLFIFDNRPDVKPEQRNNTEALVFWSRAMVTLLAVALGATLFLFTRSLWGDAAGLVTLAFFCLNPQTIALGAFATTDISSTLFFTLATLAVWRLLNRVSLLNILLTGVVAGLLGATKISSIMLVPVAGLLLVLRLLQPWLMGQSQDTATSRPPAPAEVPAWLKMIGGLAAAVLVAYATLWAVYGFRFSATDQTAFDPAFSDSLWGGNALVQSHFARPIIKFFRGMHLFPEAYLYDLHLFTTTGSIRRAFILGEYSVDGWWYFFPVAWLFKTPLPLLAALGGGIALLWRARRAQAAALWALAPLLVFAAVYTAATLASNLNIGARHLLPLHPLMFVLAGAVVLLPFAAWRRWAVTGALVAWSFAEAALVHPHHLAYYNELAGGTLHGHRILVDSSYEWGEGLPQVRDWLAVRADNQKTQKDKPPVPVFLSYFGCADLEHYGLKNILRPDDGGSIVQLPSFYDQRPVRPYELGAGTYIISATMLKSLYGAGTMGPWRPSYEQKYRELCAELGRLRTALGNDAARDGFLEKEGRDLVRQQAQAQLANADLLPRDQIIQLLTNALMQTKQWNDFTKKFADPAALDNALETEGRNQLKMQGKQQLAIADTATLTRAQAIEIATNALAQAGKLDEFKAKNPDDRNRDDFLVQEGQRIFKQQFIAPANTIWMQKIRLHDELRFARLCAYLRGREPESRIGYGILVFELGADELARAIDPAVRPAELRTDYFVKGTENRKEGEIDFIR